MRSSAWRSFTTTPTAPAVRRTADALQACGRAESVFRDLLLRTGVLAQLDRQAAPGDASSEGYLLHQIGTIHGGRDGAA